jgi:HAD superfamily hydrolase (TIGR01509 family)
VAVRALLFDLDGTVWDSFPWYVEVLAEHGDSSDLEKRLRRGESIIRVAEACGLARARFFRTCSLSTAPLRLFPGVLKTLESLAARGTPVGAVTSLPGQLALSSLERVGLSGRFATVIHAGHGRPYKPNPRPLRLALCELGLKPDPSIYYVGDYATDGQAAHAAGLQFAWASYGYGGAQPPTADVVITNFADVLRL